MKRSLKTFQFLIVTAFLFVLTTAASAQCDHTASAAAYQKFLDNYKGKSEQQKAANDAGKEYLAKFGDCMDEGDKRIAEYVRSWQQKYELQIAEDNCTAAVDKTPNKAFDVCRPYVEKKPEDAKPYLLLTEAGVKNYQGGDEKAKYDTAKVAQKALDLISAGKTPNNWVIGHDQKAAVGALNYYVGVFTAESSPKEAVTALTNAARSETSYSKDPTLYMWLGRVVYSLDYKSQADDFNAKCTVDKPPVDCQQLRDKADQVLDRVIDAYARAVAYSKDAQEAAKLKSILSDHYKMRHAGSTDGLDQYIREVLSKPMPN